MWLICRATINRGKNKLLIRGVEGAEWVFCPLIKSLQRDRVSTDRCQRCRYFVRFEQIHVPETRNSRFFRTIAHKGTYHILRSPLGSGISHSRAPRLSYVPGLITEKEPLLDIFDEGDRLIVLAELPSIDEDNLNIEVEENVLTISTDIAAKRYLQKVRLPASIRKDTIEYTYNNGILQVRLEKLYFNIQEDT